MEIKEDRWERESLHSYALKLKEGILSLNFGGSRFVLVFERNDKKYTEATVYNLSNKYGVSSVNLTLSDTDETSAEIIPKNIERVLDLPGLPKGKKLLGLMHKTIEEHKGHKFVEAQDEISRLGQIFKRCLLV